MRAWRRLMRRWVWRMLRWKRKKERFTTEFAEGTEEE
jgi:hypothetical protein